MGVLRAGDWCTVSQFCPLGGATRSHDQHFHVCVSLCVSSGVCLGIVLRSLHRLARCAAGASTVSTQYNRELLYCGVDLRL